ncbi:MAG: trigger factor [Thermodesulfobacteriota bacterium]
MKVSVDDISRTEKKIEVIIPSEQVKEKRDFIFNQFKLSAKIKGFRAGKAPNHLIESMYGKNIKDEIISKLVSESFENAITETSLTPINRPNITPGEINHAGEFQYSAVFEILPEFELSNYYGLNLKKDKYEVENKDIENTLKRLRENNSKSKLIEDDRPAGKGDYVFVDYAGTLEDGGVIDDLKKENVRFLIGENQLIPEFEENILGKKRGDETTFPVTYPGDFAVKEAAGKKVNFKLKINEIHERIFPDLDDDFAKDIGLENLDDLKNKIKEDIQSQYEQNADAKLKQQIIEILEEANSIDLPPSLVKSEAERLKRQFAADFQRQGMVIPETTEEVNEKFKEKAISSVKSSIILSSIAAKEKIEATMEEINERIKRIADSYQVPFKTVRETYEKNNMIENFESAIVEQKVINLIREKANIEDVLVKKDKIDNEISG